MHSSIVSLNWFFRLRLFAAVSQFVLLLVAYGYFKVELPIWQLISLISVVPTTQAIAFLVLLRGVEERVVGGSLLVLDTLILTAILALSGGAANPFSIVYFLHVVLAALILGKRWAWTIAIMTIVGFAGLFSVGDSSGHTHMAHGGYLLHLSGMFFSYCLVVTVSAYFLGKIIDELRVKQGELNELEANQRKLIAIAALSANAAHELSTPLATIELVAHELACGSEVVDKEDLSILSSEVQRCKSILADICTSGGTPKVEQATDTTAGELQELLCGALREVCSQVSWKLVENIESLVLPRRAIVVAVKALIENAIEASPGGEPVKVLISFAHGEMNVTVEDNGTGMSQSEIESLGEPFYSSKPEGMGLGVYVARLVAKQLSGSLNFSSKVGKGTIAEFVVPGSVPIARGVAV